MQSTQGTESKTKPEHGESSASFLDSRTSTIKRPTRTVALPTDAPALEQLVASPGVLSRGIRWCKGVGLTTVWGLGPVRVRDEGMVFGISGTDAGPMLNHCFLILGLCDIAVHRITGT